MIKEEIKIKFMDFCSWIWWWRLWAELLWFKCVWFSEIDKDAINWYNILFWDEKNYWDLMKINLDKLPDFNLMIAWFPCQTFSIMWLRKWFDDERWQIIFWLLKILEYKKVDYFLFENVKGLLNIDNWNTLKNIINELNNIWYIVDYKLLNTKDFWLPQSRERVYIFWYRKELKTKNNLKKINSFNEIKSNIKHFLIDEDKKYIFNDSTKWWDTFIKYLNNKYNKWKYDLKEILKDNYLVLDTRHSDLRLYKWLTPTLRKWRHWILYVRNWELRKLSWYESMLLQWFPKNHANNLSSKLSDTKILWLTWNAMSVNVIKNILSLFIK